jgi:serine/threonine protein kinase
MTGDSIEGSFKEVGDENRAPSTALSGSTLEDYVIGKQIGQGAYATVVFGVHKESNRKVAIKVYDKYKLLDPQRRKSVRCEIRLMERLKHPNIVMYHDALDTAKQIHIVMDHVSGGSLHHFLKKRPGRKLEDHLAKRLFFQVCQGIKYMHERHVVHRDIKLENLLLDESGSTHPNDCGVVKIIDFGFSTIVPPGKKLKVFCGTPSYMSPEIVSRKEYAGFCADIWAMGVLLYALLCGSFPFRGQNDRDLYRKIIRGAFHVPEVVTDGARRLLSRVLMADMARRPTVEETLVDAWLSNHRDELYPVVAHRKSEKIGYQPDISTCSIATTAAPSSSTVGQSGRESTDTSVSPAARSVGSASRGAAASRLEHPPAVAEVSIQRSVVSVLTGGQSEAPLSGAANNGPAGGTGMAAAIAATSCGVSGGDSLPVERSTAAATGGGAVPSAEGRAEQAVNKLERLGYPREEILRQLNDESSHLCKLYHRFLKALTAWDAKK